MGRSSHSRTMKSTVPHSGLCVYTSCPQLSLWSPVPFANYTKDIYHATYLPQCQCLVFLGEFLIGIPLVFFSANRQSHGHVHHRLYSYFAGDVLLALLMPTFGPKLVLRHREVTVMRQQYKELGRVIMLLELLDTLSPKYKRFESELLIERKRGII